MRLENDDNFNFLYNEEYNKIPAIFRWGKKRFIAALIIMGVFFVGGMIFLSLFNNSAEYTKITSVDAVHFFGFNSYDYSFLVAMILCFVVIAVIAAWICISKLFEKRAFRKASELSNMIFLTERHRAEVEWQNWKMHNRDY